MAPTYDTLTKAKPEQWKEVVSFPSLEKGTESARVQGMGMRNSFYELTTVIL